MASGAADLKHFYIPEEQSVYLLSHQDAQKLRDWIQLCIDQLTSLGYTKVFLLGKGAFGFVFAGDAPDGRKLVFKFSRADLAQSVQDRLAEEAAMLGQIQHPNVPKLVSFQQVRHQSILVMERAAGIDLEQYSLVHGPLSPKMVVAIATQLIDILLALRSHQHQGESLPIVHGDIKPSNLVFDPDSLHLALIDWGSSVYAQLDESGHWLGPSLMGCLGAEPNQTNARLGDIYFIGEEQLAGKLSNSRFDEQGLASTLYALASGQSCRFGHQVIGADSLFLPKPFAALLQQLLSGDYPSRCQAADTLFRQRHWLQKLVFVDGVVPPPVLPHLPVQLHASVRDIETVVYSSRQSFLRQQGITPSDGQPTDDAQLARYYKLYLQGMGDKEKAFVAAVSRLGRYPVVGGLAIHWQEDGIYVDSSLHMYAPDKQHAFISAVNNVVALARSIDIRGVFKSCMFNAKHTLHLQRQGKDGAFIPEQNMCIPYEVSQMLQPGASREHSYFEDGEDPDELLVLPESMMALLHQLNQIQHTGCIIFEALEQHLKIHNYYVLLDLSQEHRFKQLLGMILDTVTLIKGVGICGYMKLPYKDTRFFAHQVKVPMKFYPRNPYTFLAMMPEDE